MKFKKPFRGVPKGQIMPVQFKAGDDCPPELEDAARAFGALPAKKTAASGGKTGGKSGGKSAGSKKEEMHSEPDADASSDASGGETVSSEEEGGTEPDAAGDADVDTPAVG